MNNKVNYYEDILFEYVKRIKRFNNLICIRYQLDDIPFNLSGKAFPKIGSLVDDNGRTISYRFHGRGATFFEEEVETYFSIDTSSKYQIIISVGGFYCFLKTYLKDYDEGFPLEQMMEELEQRGVFIQRKHSDLGVFHVNEQWYHSLENNLPFSGENKFDTDWV